MPFGTASAMRFMKTPRRISDTADMILAKEAKKAYRKLAQNRHSVAHGGETDISLNELQCMHDLAKGVPLAFAVALRRRFVQGD